MKYATLESIFRALESDSVQYVVVGGLAVNAHGYQRLTQDVDLCFAMDAGNVRAALEALGKLGYRPTLPVDMFEFADPQKREDWVTNRNLAVFSLVSEAHRDATIDILATVPFDFGDEYIHAFVGELAPGLHVRFARIETLIAMKQSAGRPRDLDDVEHLRMIQEESVHDE